VDGLTPTTTDALHDESREHSRIGGLPVTFPAANPLREYQPAKHGRAHAHRVATLGGLCDVPVRGQERPSIARRTRHRLPVADSIAVRGAPQVSDRVQLMAPARWKSGDMSAHRIERAVPMTAPAQWKRSRAVHGRLISNEASPSAQDWLLPPMWPLDGWRVTAVAGLCRVVDARIVPWARTRMMEWSAWASAYRYRLAAGFAISAVAGIAITLLRIGVPHADTQSAPVRTLTVMPASPAPVAAIAAPISASESADSQSVRSGPAETDHRLLSDVSTMDLMMPVEEPDLDITSRQSLWSEIGKASGVDPLLLYSVALVESKALYPDGKVAPTPWLFRVNDHLVRGDRHDVQLAMAAASQFGSAVQDVGIMQVYYPMHRDAVRDPLALLNPRTNITVAAKILRDGMHETSDRVLGVGYYHSHTPALARDYGTAVLTVYQRLKTIHRAAGHTQVVAR
jgi:Transglycosylase SLT domain.